MTTLPYRWIVFDAVGTLIVPQPDVSDIYNQIAHRFGSRLSQQEIQQRFRHAYHTLSTHIAFEPFQTSEDLEYHYWQQLVACVLSDVNDPQGCFQTLYDHFAQPVSWQLMPGVLTTLEWLNQNGYKIAIASNFDSRLRQILRFHGVLNVVHQLMISSEIGWKKPAIQFYQHVIAHTSSLPQKILFIGDDLENDFFAPQRSGLHALLLTNHPPDHSTPIDPSGILTALKDLPIRLNAISSTGPTTSILHSTPS